MAKYNINESFGIRAYVTAPVNPPMVSLAGVALSHANDMLNKIEGIRSKTFKIDVDNGKIDVHVISPDDDKEDHVGIIDIHGGGFVFDGAPHMYTLASQYALKTGAVIIFPRYRLAPRYSFPTQINDCIATYNWVKENARQLNIDINKMAVMGDSAGGYLAALTVNYGISVGDRLLFQLLIYPVTDPLMTSESMKKYADTPVWNAKNNRSMWRMYFRRQEVNLEEQSLLYCQLPEGIPETYVETAEFDCLHDEGILYAERIRKNGSSVTIYETKETMHGFDEVKCEITDEAVKRRIEFMNSVIKRV